MFSKLKRGGPVAALSVLTVMALGLTACTGGDSKSVDTDVNTVSAEVASAVDEAVENALTLSGSTEAVIGVWTGDDSAYVRGFGAGVDATTSFNAAQASQPVMCALLLSFAKDGEIALGRDVTKDLTRLPGVEDVTYKQLCDQTSAISDFKSGLTERFTNNPTRPWPEQELISNGLVRSPLAWPGENVYLSDTNAVLLDRAMRLHTRGKTSELLRERVFTPSGMKSSSYPASFDAKTVQDGHLQPTTYPVSGGSPVCDAGITEIAEYSPSMLRGAGSTQTTVTDLKRFYDAYFDGAFASDADAGVVNEVRPAKNPERDEEGVATSEPDTEGRQIGFGGVEKIGPLFGRSGAVTGTITAAYTNPDSGLTVVVALNNSSAGASFAQALAFQLAALTGTELPWTAEEQGEKLTEKAVCQAPPETEEAAG